MENFRDCLWFWREVVVVFLELRGHLSTILLSVSFWLNWIVLVVAIPSVIGILRGSGLLWSASVAGLCILTFLFFIVTPYRIWKRDSLSRLRDIQRKELHSHPQTYVDVRIGQVVLHAVESASEGYATVKFCVFNGSVFDMQFRWDCINKTQVYLDLEAMEPPVSLPLEPRVANPVETLPPGRHDDNLRISQPLPSSIVTKLEQLCTSKRVKWHFDLKVTITFDGESKEETYPLDWEEIPHRIYYDRVSSN